MHFQKCKHPSLPGTYVVEGAGAHRESQFSQLISVHYKLVLDESSGRCSVCEHTSSLLRWDIQDDVTDQVCSLLCLFHSCVAEVVLFILAIEGKHGFGS